MVRLKLKSDTTTKTLQELNLSQNEAVLYSQMISHPRSTVQELGTRAPFPRTMLYYVLKQLMQRGLVSAKKEKWRTVYIAENPERLYDLLARKEQEFVRDTDAIRDLIPSVDRVLVMTVHPGFGGQRFLYDMLPKVRQIADAAKHAGRRLEIGIDGGVDQETLPQALANGGNVMIVGSSVFRAMEGISEAISRLRAIKVP